ncbi:MAG: MFS transporter [Hyphomonadaceae bacterium]
MDHHAQRPARGAELRLYYLLVGLYFFTFGVQIVLFPSLVAFSLGADPELVGVAQMAISAPMFVFLLFGGALAERAKAGPTLGLLQAMLAAPMLALAWIVAIGAVTYSILIVYAVLVGTIAAFMLPVRDSALNGVVERDLARGRSVSLSRAAATTAAVQIGAQILGILLARMAGNHPAPFLIAMAVSLLIGAVLSLRLQAPRPEGQRGRSLISAFGDIWDGLKYAFRSPVMGPMIGSAAYVGVFMVGSFQVLFPLIVRDAYGGTPAEQAGRLGFLFACFWGACFVSAAILSRLPPIKFPGRALVLSHLVGAFALASFAIDKPFLMFAAIVIVWGLAGGISISSSRMITQAAAEPRYLGRVLAAYSMGFMGGAPIGSVMVGFASAELGSHMAALVPGIGLALAIVALIAFTPIWRVESTVAAPPS